MDRKLKRFLIKSFAVLTVIHLAYFIYGYIKFEGLQKIDIAAIKQMPGLAGFVDERHLLGQFLIEGDLAQRRRPGVVMRARQMGKR